MKLGDAVSTVATPVAEALGLDCVDEFGQLKPESNCARRRDSLNKFGDKIYDFMWPDTTKKE